MMQTKNIAPRMMQSQRRQFDLVADKLGDTKTDIVRSLGFLLSRSASESLRKLLSQYHEITGLEEIVADVLTQVSQTVFEELRGVPDSGNLRGIYQEFRQRQLLFNEEYRKKSYLTISLPVPLYKRISETAASLESSMNDVVLALIEWFIRLDSKAQLALVDTGKSAYDRFKKSGDIDTAAGKFGRKTIFDQYNLSLELDSKVLKTYSEILEDWDIQLLSTLQRLKEFHHYEL